MKIFQQFEEKEEVGHVLTSIGDNQVREAEVAAALGDKTTSKNKFIEALKTYYTVLKIREEIRDTMEFDDAFIKLGNINIKLKKISAAKNYLSKSLELAKSISDKGALKDTYISLSYLDSIQGNYKQAYKHYQMYILYRNSL